MPRSTSSEPLRYERKFLITDYSHLEVEQMIKFHPACFSEIFHERIVNNIYFDTLGFSNYYDNVEGAPDRIKVRIRWYDNLFGAVKNAILEYKIKKGLLGKKESYNLLPFSFDEHFTKEHIRNAIAGTTLPDSVQKEILSLQPTILNSYTRKYFLSRDKKFRITIDHHLTFYRIGYNDNNFVNKSVNHKACVLELKYDSEFEKEAKEVGSNFPFSMTKNSKYLEGLERILFNS